VTRYALDIEQMFFVTHMNIFPPKVHRVLIGPSIDEETLHEAWACQVRFVGFQAQLHLDLSDQKQDFDKSVQYYDKLGEIAKRPEWSFLREEVELIEVEDKWKESEEARRKEFGRFNPYLNTPDEYDKLMDNILEDDGADMDEEENHG
jgi:hypothetical protein